MLLDRISFNDNGDFLSFEAHSEGFKITVKRHFETVIEKNFQDCLEAIEFYKETKKNESLHFHKKIELLNT